MYYCYDEEQGLFQEEKKHAKDIGLFIIYDDKKDQFFDKDGKQIDIAGQEIFVRTGVFQTQDLVDTVIRHNGLSLTTKNDYEKVSKWPNYVKTSRKVMLLTGQQIIENPQTIIDNFGTGEIFFKTREKNYSGIVDVSKIVDEEAPFHKAIEAHLEDDFIVSDVVEIEEDEIGNIEYRAFIVNNKLLNVSRIHGYLLGQIPEYVITRYNELILSLKDTDFSNSYVMDLFVCKGKNGDKNTLEVLECNPIEASGTYLYNSPFINTYDLLHTCPSVSLPSEKKKYWNMKYCSYDKVNTTVPSILYNLAGGFAADVLSYTFLGEKTTKGQVFHVSFETKENLNPMNIGLQATSPLVEDFNCFDSDSDFNEEDEEIKQLRKKFLANSKKEEE